MLADKPDCTHERTSLVQHYDTLRYDKEAEPEEIWFACWQCDECGAITQQPVSPDDLEAAVNAPFLDVDGYSTRTAEHLRHDLDIRSYQFITRAAHTFTNGNSHHRNGYHNGGYHP